MIGGLIVGLGGDLVGGFGIGDVHITIWGRGIWSRDSVPLAVSEVLQGFILV